MVLTPTKAHDQITPILSAIPRTLQHYGHGPTKAIYTDQPRTDKNVLERTFPSLVNGVIPVTPLPSFESLKFPSHWKVVDLSNATLVNDRMNIIMNHRFTSDHVVVAVDMEWPVDLRAKPATFGPVALIQLAYQEQVYFIQVCRS